MCDLLVSVVVISYNSGATILETLESINNQTYLNLELIISDDCSSDNCVELAKEWVQTHEERFVRCMVQKNPENLGIPGNLNAGFRLSQGQYIKVLAADDLLLPNCIALNVAYCEENGYDNLSSRVYPFRMQEGKKVYEKEPYMDLAFFEKTAQEQYRDELVENRVVSPTIFLKKGLLEQMGMYDLRYRYMEDYPMYVKMLKRGHKLNFLDAYTVEYRLSDASLSHTVSCRVVHPGYHRTVKEFFFRVRLRGLLRHGYFKRVLGEMCRYFFADLIILAGNDREKQIVRMLEAIRDKKWK